jgi:hypothetical protein
MYDFLNQQKRQAELFRPCRNTKNAVPDAFIFRNYDIPNHLGITDLTVLAHQPPPQPFRSDSEYIRSRQPDWSGIRSF